MTEAEKIIREKAVWLIVGGMEDIMTHRITTSLFSRGGKFLAAIMPLEEEDSVQNSAPGRSD